MGPRGRGLMHPVRAIARFVRNMTCAHAGLAEEEFKAVIDLGDAASLPGALSGLVFAYYYQAKFRDAVTQAEAFLRLRPDNEGMKEIKAIAEEQARKAGQ